MDLRIQKTLDIIRKQFLLLRKTTPLNKIRVNAICERAKINKTTFYRHYLDVFDLSEKIEEQTISEFMSDADGSDCLFTDPERFIKGFFLAVKKHERVINILFRDRLEVFVAKFEAALLSLYLPESASPEEAIKVSFIIGGAAHVFMKDKHNLETDSKVLADLLRRISV